MRVELKGLKVKKRSRKLPPITPGEILSEEFMEPYGLSGNKLATALHVPTTRITAILNARRAISPDTALRLGRYFNTSARFWLNLQSSYELEVLEDHVGSQVEHDVQPIMPIAARPCT